MLLNEVSEFAPKKLEEFEHVFALLKKSHNNKSARFKLLQLIKDFTKIHDVVVFIDDEFNLGVVTKYKDTELLSLIKSFLFMFVEKNPPLSNKKLRKLESVEESSENIEIIYIFIGKPLLKFLTPKELVAVLLHELGHVFSTSDEIPNNILLLLKSILIRPIKLFGSDKDQIVSRLTFLYTMTVSLLIRGITFTQHIGEYRADNFALKYGYGDELITALNKIKTVEKIKTRNFSKANSIIKSIINFLKKIFVPSSNDLRSNPHPDTISRIEKLENQIFEEYKNTYPKYKEVFDLIRADYKAREAKTK